MENNIGTDGANIAVTSPVLAGKNKHKFFIILVIILILILAGGLGFFYWQSYKKTSNNVKPSLTDEKFLLQQQNPYVALGTTTEVSQLLPLIKNIPIDKDATGEMFFNKDISDSLKQQTRLYSTKTNLSAIVANYKAYLKTQKLPIISEVNKDNYKFLAAGPTNYRLAVNINRNTELNINEVSVSFNFLLLRKDLKK